MSSALSLDHNFRIELQSFLRNVLRSELQEFGCRVQSDLREQFQRVAEEHSSKGQRYFDQAESASRSCSTAFAGTTLGTSARKGLLRHSAAGGANMTNEDPVAPAEVPGSFVPYAPRMPPPSLPCVDENASADCEHVVDGGAGSYASKDDAAKVPDGVFNLSNGSYYRAHGRERVHPDPQTGSARDIQEQQTAGPPVSSEDAWPSIQTIVSGSSNNYSGRKWTRSSVVETSGCNRGRHRSTWVESTGRLNGFTTNRRTTPTFDGAGSCSRLLRRYTWEREGSKSFLAPVLQSDFKQCLVLRVAARIVKSDAFDYVMCACLMANAVAMGVQADEMSGRGDVTPIRFHVVQMCFCVLFTLELLLRLSVHRLAFFCTKGWQWNLFDTLVVSFQLLEELMLALRSGSETEGFIEKAGLLRFFRLGRVARLIRMVHLIPELKSMVYLISASMWSFFWTAALLTLLMYCVAVFFTEAASDMMNDERNEDTLRRLKSYWGSVTISMTSLFQSISGGDDWHKFVDVLERQSALNAILFSIYIAFATLVMLNLVTGVFVEGAQRILREDRDSELKKQVRKLFADADTDSSHDISWEEFKKQIQHNRMDEYFQAVDLSRQEAEHLFLLLDIDQSGSISAEEFVRGCLRLRGPARSIELATMAHEMGENSNRVQENLLAIEEGLMTVTEFMRTLHIVFDACAKSETNGRSSVELASGATVAIMTPKERMEEELV